MFIKHLVLSFIDGCAIMTVAALRGECWDDVGSRLVSFTLALNEVLVVTFGIIIIL